MHNRQLWKSCATMGKFEQSCISTVHNGQVLVFLCTVQCTEGKFECSCEKFSARWASFRDNLDKGQGCNDAIFGSNLDVLSGQEHVTCEPQGCNHLLWLQSESPLDTPAAGSGQEFLKKTIIY